MRSIGLQILLVVFVATFAWPQTSTTSLRGTVVDPKGAVITAADVTIVNSATGFSRTTKTNDEGFYNSLKSRRLRISSPSRRPGLASWKWTTSVCW